MPKRLARPDPSGSAGGELNWTALHHAALHRNLGVMKLLVDRKAWWAHALHAFHLFPFSIDQGDDAGNTPLHIAAFHGRLCEIELLLEGKADIDKTNSRGETALIQACQGKAQLTKAMVGMLLARGADPSIKTASGQTAFDLAPASLKQRLIPVPAAPPAPFPILALPG